MSAREAAQTLRARDALARAEAQREFVRPIVLEAGAGTGKTATLVARVVTWCAGPGWTQAADALAAAGSPASCERVAARTLSGVVAITFTEAAAAEMASRVDAALAALARGEVPVGLDAAGLPPEVDRLERVHALRGALDHLVVQTIHAYCRRLLAANPLEAGLHPRLEVDADGGVQAAIVREVLDERLRRAYGPDGDPGALALAARGFGPAELETELQGLLARGVTAAALAPDPLAPERIAEVVARLRAAIVAFGEAGGDRLGAAKRGKAAVLALAALDQTSARLADAAPSTPEGLAALVAEVSALFEDARRTRLTKWGKGDFTAGEADAAGSATGAITEAAARLAGAVGSFCDLDVETLALAHPRLRALLAEVETRLRRRGVTTFGALLTGAAGLLSGSPAVAARVRRDIDQLLVDEFQDTDRWQCRVVGTLALEGPAEERPGLFVVGDPKQSIYGWRSADLAAYEAFAQRVEAAGGLRRSLVVNHRSVPAILDEVERLIAPVMQRVPGLQPAFERLVPSPDREGAAGFTAGAQVTLERWIPATVAGEPAALAGTTASLAAQIEASALARDLRRLHDEHGVGWGDVGVLFRSRGDWDVYLSALREAGVPFAVEGDRSYYRRREIIDAAAWARCVLDPNDTLALLAWLRSAVVGVPDAALIPLWARGLPEQLGALVGPDAAAIEGIRTAASAAVAALPAAIPGLARVRGWNANLVAAAEALAELRASFERDPVDVFVERLRTRLLLEATEAARFLGSWRVANLERFFADLAAALSEGGDVRAVARGLRHAVAEEEPMEEGQPPDLASDAVRVLTLHGAKGLDFEHVYLLQLHKGTARAAARGPDADEIDGRLEARLCGAPTLGWDRVGRTRARVSEMERVRTLYVGLTRAKQRLVVSGLPPSLQRHSGSDTHAALLEARQGGVPGAAVLAACTPDTYWVDHDGVRFVLPALAPEPRDLARSGSAAASAADPARARRDSERLLREAAAARERMQHPLGGAASDEAHAEENEVRAAWLGTGEGAGAIPRARARAVGTVVHHALEQLDLDADPADAFARAREALVESLRSQLSPPDQGAALHDADALLATVARGPLAARLHALQGHVLARELPVLVQPGAGEGPLAFVTGAIDLVYRDPDSGEIVVVDYKTDPIDDPAQRSERGRRYARQGAVYQRALRDAFGLATLPRFELWWLAHGEVECPARPVAGPTQLRLEMDAPVAG